MKLFQKLLLTPALLGFVAPMTADASETNLMDVSNYSQVDVQVTQDTFKPLSSKNPLLAGGEGLNQNFSSDNDFDVDSFSATTTATFSSNFLLGAVDKDGGGDTVNFVHDYGLELTSTTDGNDSIVMTFDSGSNAPQGDFDIANTQNTKSATVLKVDGLTYTRSLGDKLAFFVGGNGAPGSTLYTSACAYGGQTDVLDDCGIRTTNLDEGLGTSFGASFEVLDGLTAAVGYEGQGAEAKGLMTKEATDAFGAQVAYTGDNFGVAVAFSSIENHDASAGNGIDADRGVTTSSAFSAYYAPQLQNFPSISVGFESSHDDSAAASADEKSNYFVGLQWDEFGNGSLGASFGSKAPEPENQDPEKMYEVFYSYNYADGITITPLMFVKENAAANVNDETGIFLKTSFSF